MEYIDTVQQATEITRYLSTPPRKPSILTSPVFQFLLFIIFILLVAWGTYALVKAIKNIISERIYKKLQGELGVKLKAILPNDAVVYTVDTDAITWQNSSGNGKVIYYSNLGFQKLTAGYESVVCYWIRDNIVSDRRLYSVESMTYHGERYEESNTGTIERRYDGKFVIKRDPGRYVDTKITLGCALVRDGYNFEGQKINKTPLKSW